MVWLVTLAALWGQAAPQAPQDLSFEEVRFHRVHLKNGNFIDGALIRDTKRDVALKMKYGEFVVSRDLVARVEFIKMRSLREPPEVLPEPKAKPKEGTKLQPTHPEVEREKARPMEPLSLVGFPDELRKQVDGLLGLDSTAVSAESLQALADRIQALGPQVTPYLCALLDQRRESAPVRVICMALGGLKDPRSVPSLKGLLQVEEPDQRTAAVKALASLGAKECVPPMIDALNDDWSGVPPVAVEALVELNQKFPNAGIPRLLARDLPKSRGKAFFARALGKIGGDDVRRAFHDLLREDDEPTVAAALQGLSLMATEEDGPAVQRVLDSRFRSAKQTACVVLAKIKYRPAVPDLIRILRGEDLGLITTAHSALQEISGERLAADPATWQNWWDTVGSKPQ